MSSFDTGDLKSEINTIMNKSDEPMEDPTETIFTENTPNEDISKFSNSLLTEAEVGREILFSTRSNNSDFIPRPHTLDEFVEKEKVTEINNETTSFSLEDLDDDEDIWVVDIPKTIDPLQLKGQVFQLGDKSKFKIGGERYCATNRESKSNVTCVFNTDDNTKYEAVNIKLSGTISIRRKLSESYKKQVEYERTEAVPFPKNLKQRHPLFGAQIENS